MRTTQKDIDDQLPAFAQRLKASGLHIVPKWKTAVGKPLTRKQFMAYPDISDHQLRRQMYDHIVEIGGMIVEGNVMPTGGSLFSREKQCSAINR